MLCGLLMPALLACSYPHRLSFRAMGKRGMLAHPRGSYSWPRSGAAACCGSWRLYSASTCLLRRAKVE